MSSDFPVRGPTEFQADEVEFEGKTYRARWRYSNEWSTVPLFKLEDPFAAFVGQERIFVDGVEVYWHAYHGGLIRDKYFPSVLQ